MIQKSAESAFWGLLKGGKKTQVRLNSNVSTF